MRRSLILGIILTAVGCDRVFGLTRDESDARIDTPADVALDAAPCVDPTGADEDLDGVLDACDNCPQTPQTSFDDDDQDGVGNACDPNPGKRDTQVAFFNFRTVSPQLGLRVDPGPGTWMLSNGALVLANAVVDGDYLAFYDAGARDVTVDTAVTITSLPAVQPGHSQSIGLWTDIDAASPDPTFPTGMVYELVSVPAMNFAHITETFHLPTNTVESSPAPTLFTSGRRYQLRFACQGITAPTCVGRATFDLNNTTVTIALPSGTTRTGGVGLRVHGDVTAAFDYLVVYRGPE